MKHFLLPLCFGFFLLSCGKEQKEITTNVANDTVVSAKTSESVPPIQKTSKSQNSINPKYSPESLYGIWTVDNDGPHADFELTKKSFYVVDYDGDGDMPYTLKHDTLTVMYGDYNSTGIIKKVVKDTMVINWNNTTDVTYVTWKG